MTSLKKPLQVVFSFGLLALFVWLLLRNVDFTIVKQAFVKANWALIAIAFIFMPLLMVVRALRWRYLLCAYTDIRFSSVFEVTCVSRTLGNVLPFRAADVLQGVLLGKKEKLDQFSMLASVMAERVIDLLFLVIFFAIISFFMFIPPNMKQYVYISVAAIFGGFFLAIYNIRKIAVIAGKFSALIGQKILLFEPGLQSFKNPRIMMIVSVLTLVGWIINILFSGLILIAFGIHCSALMLVAYQVVPSLACIVPSSPGFVGVWDFFAVSTLTTFNVEKSLALSATAFIHFYGVIGTAALGLYYMGKTWLFQFVKKE